MAKSPNKRPKVSSLDVAPKLRDAPHMLLLPLFVLGVALDLFVGVLPVRHVK
jgi:hypothetical protein